MDLQYTTPMVFSINPITPDTIQAGGLFWKTWLPSFTHNSVLRIIGGGGYWSIFVFRMQKIPKKNHPHDVQYWWWYFVGKVLLVNIFRIQVSYCCKSVIINPESSMEPQTISESKTITTSVHYKRMQNIHLINYAMKHSTEIRSSICSLIGFDKNKPIRL